MALTYKLIKAETLISNTSVVTFDNIPNTYTHLVWKISARGTANSPYASGVARLNDSSANVKERRYASDGTSSGAYYDNIIGALWGYGAGATSTADVFGYTEVMVIDYRNSLAKTLLGNSILPQATSNVSIVVTVGNNLDSVTSAVTKVTFLDPYGGYGDSIAGSTFYLYGILQA